MIDTTTRTKLGAEEPHPSAPLDDLVALKKTGACTRSPCPTTLVTGSFQSLATSILANEAKVNSMVKRLSKRMFDRSEPMILISSLRHTLALVPRNIVLTVTVTLEDRKIRATSSP
jgi:hypothetical protein